MPPVGFEPTISAGERPAASHLLRHFGKQMNKETKLKIHNITAKAVLNFGSEAWVLKKREEQRLEAAQMKFLRHLLGITKLDKEKDQCIRGKKREHRT